jgi:Flp pilus assembly protein TadD
VVGFLPALFAPFLLDDRLLVAENPLLRGIHLREIATSGYWGAYNPESGLYRPLSILGLSLIRNLAGPSPVWFRLANLALHLAATLLFFLCVRRWLGGAAAHGTGDGWRERLPFLAALLFAVHAVHAEPLLFAVGFADLLAGALVMGSLAAWLGHLRTGAASSLGLALLLFGLSLLAKESGVFLPLLAALTVPMVPGTGDGRGGRRRSLLSLAAFAAAALPVLAVRWLVMGSPVPAGGSRILAGARPGEAVKAVLTAFAGYVRLLAEPFPLRADHHLEPPLPLLPALAGLALLVILAALAVRWRRTRPEAAWGLAWFLIALLPVSNIVPIGALMAERFLYLPSAGFCLALAATVGRAGAGNRRFLLGTMTVLVLFHLGLAWTRSLDWNDPVAFWRREAALAPGSSLSQANLGQALYQAGERRDAEWRFREAVHLNPSNPFPRLNLAVSLLERGAREEGTRVLEEAVRIRPAFFLPRLMLGREHLARGEAAQAEARLRETHQRGHRTAETTRLLGFSLLAQGKSEEAAGLLEESLGREGGDPETRYALGNALLSLGRFAPAAASYREALLLRPGEARYLNNLGIALGRTGDPAGAHRALEEASRRSPDWADPRLNRARLLEEEGRRPEAARLYREALELRPGWDLAREGLDRTR